MQSTPEELDRFIEENSIHGQDQEAYQVRYDQLCSEYIQVTNQYEKFKHEVDYRLLKRKAIEKHFNKQNIVAATFDKCICMTLFEEMLVFEDHVEVKFKNGIVVPISL